MEPGVAATIDCLTNGAPHAAEAQAFHDFFATLAPGHGSDFVRCYTAFDLNHRMRKVRARDFAIVEFGACLRDCVETARKLIANEAIYRDLLTPRRETGRNEGGAAADTQELYGRLFRDFSEENYYETSFEILKQRFDVNGVAIDVPGRKVALDAGCGGGRFTLALKRMGFVRHHRAVAGCHAQRAAFLCHTGARSSRARRLRSLLAPRPRDGADQHPLDARGG